jgi:ComF family protein
LFDEHFLIRIFIKKLLIKSFVLNLIEIFYPKLCVNCKNSLLQNENILCTFCRHDLPLTKFPNVKENKVSKIFYGRVPVENTYALLYFRKKGITKKLIHHLKYKGDQEIGLFFGNWIGEQLKNNNDFKSIDCIIPVSVDKKRLKERGYNQLTKFGEQLSYHLNTPFIEDKLKKVTASKTQTFKNRFDRFTDLETKFNVNDVSFFNNKHVLLIDDVITTGATLEACAKQILKAEKCKISIVTIAYTE